MGDAAAAGAGADSRPIVVGGCHRSGTSLVRRILDAHPRIHCASEVKFFRDLRGDWVDDPIGHVRFMRSARALASEETLLEVLGAAFVELHERAARATGKPRWADKAPENAVFLDEWAKLLGDGWLFLHVVREPLDTLASIKEWEFPVSIPAELDARIDLYLEYLDAGLDFERRHPARYARVVYEDLATHPEATARAMMERLGERFDHGQLELSAVRRPGALEDPKIAATASVHGESVGRWREILTPEEAERIAARTAAAWSRVRPSDSTPGPVL